MNDPTPRQRGILKLLQEKDSLSVDELRELLGISQATAYREIQDLTQMGLAKKVPGGMARIEPSPLRCVQCGRENNPRTAFLIEQTDGERLTACCSHCGLMALDRLTNVSTALTTDYLYNAILNAGQAWYVLNSRVNLCCRPSTLSFASAEDAHSFAAGFGGEALDFQQTLQKVKEAMKFSGLIQIL